MTSKSTHPPTVFTQVPMIVQQTLQLLGGFPICGGAVLILSHPQYISYSSRRCHARLVTGSASSAFRVGDFEASLTNQQTVWLVYAFFFSSLCQNT